MSIVTGKKQKFSVKDFISEEWNAIRSELHKLGFAVFENAKSNEVVLIHDVELASMNAVEGNYAGVESDALQAARVLLAKHAPDDQQVAIVTEQAKEAQQEHAENAAAVEPPKVNTNLTPDAPVNVESAQQQLAKMRETEPQKPGTENDPKQIPDAPAAQQTSPSAEITFPQATNSWGTPVQQLSEEAQKPSDQNVEAQKPSDQNVEAQKPSDKPANQNEIL